MPALGVAQHTGTLLKWLKAEGQTVSQGEPLMEIETDKATVEIEAPGSGVLTHVTAAPGDEVPVGSRIALILAPGETARATAEGSTHLDPLKKREGKEQNRASARANQSAVAPARVSFLASPAARRIARAQGVDLASLKGTGPDGSILSRDVLAAPRAALDVVSELEPKLQPLTPMRRIIAERMAHSKKTAPHFYVTVDIDMGAVIQRREEWKESGEGRKPSPNDFILYVCARALKIFPSLNASFTERGIQLHSEINLGMAVALDEGLVVPVIRNADGLSVHELAERSRELIARARTKKLLPFDYDGGTFTISNLGMLGVDSFVAIINPPQAAILAAGRIVERVIASRGMFTIRSTMTVTLSADHRAVDGAMGARFLQKIKTCLEQGEF